MCKAGAVRAWGGLIHSNKRLQLVNEEMHKWLAVNVAVCMKRMFDSLVLRPQFPSVYSI